MGIVKGRDPRTGVVYLYSSEGYRDENTGKYSYRRKLIGKLDEFGNEVPTGSRGRPRKNKDSGNKGVAASTNTEVKAASVYEDPIYLKKADECEKLRRQVLQYQEEILRLNERLKKIMTRDARLASQLGTLYQAFIKEN